VAFAPVIGLAIAQGGFFPASWGWASVPLLWCAAIALVLRGQLRLSRPELVFLGALAALSAWVACSVAWSIATADSVLETQRTVVYLAAGMAVLFVAHSKSAGHVLGGVLAATAVIDAFSLATRVLPDRIGVYDGTGVYRLAEPIGYWNGLALFTAIGALLALGFAARGRTLFVRGGCAALLVLMIPTLYFTYGRAAWIALAAGVGAAIAADPRRLQLLATLIAVAPAPALAALLAARERALTHAGSPLSAAAHDGHRLLLALLALGVANGAVAVAVGLAERRLRIGRRQRLLFAAGVSLLVAAAIATGLVRYGGPGRIAQRAYDSFKAPPPHETNLNRRLLSFSGNGRVDLWRLAFDEATNHPLLGAGAGAYERYFVAHQPKNVGFVRDAHNLYLETLTELGPLGLALLVALLLSPFLALRRARRGPLVPAAAGAYVAYLVHTGVDWDWELPAVTLAALLCAAAILLVGRSTDEHAVPLPQTSRWSLAAVAVVVAGLATVGLIGNTALSRSRTALRRGDLSGAVTDARRARTLMPWSPAPWEALGNAELKAGLVADARLSFRKAVSIDPGDWSSWSELALATTGSERRHALREVSVLYPEAAR
jgi:tetratricopeptide (TPR) repeat protein